MISCPCCGGDSRVLESRKTVNTMKRRRQCLKCRHRWSTFESAHEFGVMVKQVREMMLQIERMNRTAPRLDNIRTTLRSIEEMMIKRGVNQYK